MGKKSAKRVFFLADAARAQLPHDAAVPHFEETRGSARRGIEARPRGRRGAKGPDEFGALRMEHLQLHKPFVAQCTRPALQPAHQVAVRPERTSKAGRSLEIFLRLSEPRTVRTPTRHRAHTTFQHIFSVFPALTMHFHMQRPFSTLGRRSTTNRTVGSSSSNRPSKTARIVSVSTTVTSSPH